LGTLRAQTPPETGKIAEEDFNLFTVTDSITKAADEIAHFYKNYHSVRYVRDRMVIRLNPAHPQLNLDRDGE
jgi:hypothetical protein